MNFRFPLITAIALTLSACGTKTPMQSRKVTVPAPPEWTARESAPSPASRAKQNAWWNDFGDDGLSAAVEEALRQNYELRAAAARIKASAAQARIAGADLSPQVRASLTRARQKQNFIGFPIPGAEGNVLSSTFTNASAALDISWEADLWGRIRAGKLAATADWQASQADPRGAKLSIAAQTAKVWFAAVEAGRQTALAEATVENYTASVESVRSRYSRGLVTSLDLRLAETDLSRAKANLQQRNAQRDAALRQLEILLGRYPGAKISPAEELPVLPPPVPAGLPAEMVGRRPDLAAAERRLVALSARARQARKSLYPALTLTTSGSFVSNKMSDVLRGDFSAWSLIGGLVQRIYQGGRLRANVRLNLARSEEAETVFANAVLNAFREVETALAAERFLEQQQQHLESAVRQGVAARTLAEERYRTGLADIITVLNSQRSALDAESNLLAVRRQRLDNRVNLHLALGGGFHAAPEPSPSPPPNSQAALSKKENDPS